jgi:hypothetical protein
MTADGVASNRGPQSRELRARIWPTLRRNWLLLVGVSAAVGIRVAFWVFTNRTWEDALITLAHVRNATEGLGLTHHAGEQPVHGFTSALSVLLPLASEFVVSGSGLTSMRVASILAVIAAAMYAYAIAGHLQLSRWPTAFVLAYLAFNELHIFYGMSGMETQLAVAILLAAVYHTLQRHHVAIGIITGLAVLARPDLLLWVVPIVTWALLQGYRALLKVVIPAALLVAPWVVFTTIYYGSPVPNTVLAKAAAYGSMPSLGSSLDQWISWAGHQLSTSALALLRAFMPFYEDGTVVAAPLHAGVLSVVGLAMMALAAAGAWRLRHFPAWWPAGAYISLFVLYWCSLLPPVGYFNWYLPPFTALVALLIGAGLESLRGKRRSTSTGLALVLSLGVGLHVPFSIPLERAVQLQVDDGIRREVGLYLAEVVPPGDAVTAEAAGYIGYYSRVTLWDHPGLTSPTARAAVAALPPDHRDIASLVARLNPPWIVLRPAEWESLVREYRGTSSCYEATRAFGVPQAPLIELNGLMKWNQDWQFTVYRRAGCRP